jgi:dipeptidyl aminopeptidase/acylaminoacyl peptidase
MDELRRAATALVERPPLHPTPVPDLARRNARRHRRHRLVLGVAAALVVAAAVAVGGGGGGKPSARVITAPTSSDGGLLAVASDGGVALVSADGAVRQVGVGGQVTRLEWSHDGRWLAIVAGGELHVVARAGAPVRTVDLTGVRDARWSPVAPIVAVTADGGVATVTPRGRPHHVLDVEAAVAWAPDGLRFAYAGDDGLHVVGADGTGDRRLARYAELESAAEGLDLVGWSPDGRWLLYRGDPFRSASLAEDGLPLVARRLDDGRSFAIGTVRDPDWVRWSPDGSTLAVAEGSGRSVVSRRALRLCDLSAPRCRDVPPPAGRTVYDPAWSPDGKRLAYVVGPADVAQQEGRPGARAWVADADGSGARQLPAPQIGHPVWTGDGALVVVAGAAVWQPGGGALHVERLPTDGGRLRVLASLDAPSGDGLQGRGSVVLAWAP